MDRFLLAENPISNPNSKEYHHEYIVHTVEPRCIIEIICASSESDMVVEDCCRNYKWQEFFYRNSDGEVERWILALILGMSSVSTDEYLKVLPRAWRWYRSYIEWEDDNINLERVGKWN